MPYQSLTSPLPVPSQLPLRCRAHRCRVRREPLPARGGARERGTVEVLSGLNSGDVVVTDGVLKVRPGGPVKVRPTASASVAAQGSSDKAGLAQ